MLLKDLPADARPREKLLARGAGSLSDSELLALLLRTGIVGKSVLHLADELLADPQDNPNGFGGIAGLLNASMADLQRIKGIGPAKQAELIAVLELARRALAQQLKAKTIFTTPNAVMQYLQLHLSNRPYEVFAVLFVDAHNRMLALEEMFRAQRPNTTAEACQRIEAATGVKRRLFQPITTAWSSGQSTNLPVGFGICMSSLASSQDGAGCAPTKFC